MKKVVGTGLILSAFVFMFGANAVTHGWIDTLIGWGLAIALLSMVFGGIALLESD